MHDCMRYAPAARNARVTSFSFRLIDAGSGGWAIDTVSRSTRPTPTRPIHLPAEVTRKAALNMLFCFFCL